jgi:hypothetical protein
MTPYDRRLDRSVYTIWCESNRRYVIYNASDIGNPSDHEPNKWYFGPYPMPLGLKARECYDSAEAAEQAARTADVHTEDY